ncbi:MAG: RHS repeat-associated core domain-containing protein [Lachnospiraceae bacterium]|nr:RHS repeat-associated core domain-containing protein [Lachnospiraceae bacterium]
MLFLCPKLLGGKSAPRNQSIGEKAEIQEATTVSEEDLWKLEMLEQLIASQQEVSVSNEYCYDRENKNLLVRFSSDGTIEKYVYGNGLIASYEVKPTDEIITSDYKTYIYDIRGSVTEVANVTGNVNAEYRYSTYGDRSIISGTEFDELGYCARDGVLTEASGLLYMRARYYYPTLMRFINEDIVTGDISNSASLNRYAYVNGNPITLIDPFGLCMEKAVKETEENAFKSVGSWLKLYNTNTFSGSYRVVEIPSEADLARWAMRENRLKINKYAGDLHEVIIGDSQELLDENGRYWVAVGPNVMNPNHSPDKKVTAEEMKYGSYIDVVLIDEYGHEYYVPCVVGDAKAHTYPTGIIQSGNGFPGGCDPHPDNNDGSIIEFIGKASLSGLTDYMIKEIIVYE